MTKRYEADAEAAAAKTFPAARVYGPEAIRADSGSWQFEIQINRAVFRLPLINVASEEKPVWIAWLDPNPAKNPLLSEAAALEMAQLIGVHRPRLVVTPASTKSNHFVQEAVLRACAWCSTPIDFMVLAGGKNQEEVVKTAGSEDLVTAYHPVTSPTEPKYMGLTTEQAYRIRSLNGSDGLLFVDDVRTTGGTAEAFQKLAGRVLATPEDFRYPEAMLAAESVYGPDYPASLPSHVQTLIHIPEFAGSLPVTSLAK